MYLFVFALILTIVISLAAIFWMDSSPLEIIQSWYGGFWNLLEFGMQMVLLIITGYSIALSPLIKNGINKLTYFIKTPFQVYFFVILIGVLLSMVSWGWVVIAAVLAIWPQWYYLILDRQSMLHIRYESTCLKNLICLILYALLATFFMLHIIRLFHVLCWHCRHTYSLISLFIIFMLAKIEKHIL